MPKSLIAPVAGAVLGGVFGGKKSTSTQQSKPYLPENYEKGYATLLEDATKQYEKDRVAPYKARVEAPTSAFDSLFVSPEMLQIQQMSDANSYLSSIAPKPTAPSIAPQPLSQSNKIDLIGKAFGNNRSGNVYNQFISKATDADYSALNEALNGATQDAYGWTKNGQRVDLGAILNKYARG